MKKIKQITEHEMIAEFLKAEVNSDRWSKDIQALLERDGKNKDILVNADLLNPEENEYRKKLLGEFRGYNNNAKLFETFPKDVDWQLVSLSKEELEKVKYMHYDYWNKLSNQTRLAKVGAESITKGIKVFNISNDGFLNTAEIIKKGTPLPHMIFVTKDENSDIVVLEGHQRITAYFLIPEMIENGLDVIIGFSKDIETWDGY